MRKTIITFSLLIVVAACLLAADPNDYSISPNDVNGDFTGDYYVPNITFASYEPSHRVVFCGPNDCNIGYLDWGTGELEFGGNLAESAEVFFEYLKPYIDKYIRNEDL